MLLLALATLVAGVFFGAAAYVSLVEHPARVSCGAAVALQQFGPSYRRGTVLVVIVNWLDGRDRG